MDIMPHGILLTSLMARYEKYASSLKLPFSRTIMLTSTAPSIAANPMNTPASPLNDRNLVDSSIIVLIVFSSSADVEFFSIIKSTLNYKVTI